VLIIKNILAAIIIRTCRIAPPSNIGSMDARTVIWLLGYRTPYRYPTQY